MLNVDRLVRADRWNLVAATIYPHTTYALRERLWTAFYVPSERQFRSIRQTMGGH